MFRCNLPSALLAECPGYFTCYCGNTGMERTPNKSQHRKLPLEKKILPPLLPGFELAIFRLRVRRSNQLSYPAHYTTPCYILHITLRYTTSHYATITLHSIVYTATIHCTTLHFLTFHTLQYTYTTVSTPYYSTPDQKEESMLYEKKNRLPVSCKKLIPLQR